MNLRSHLFCLIAIIIWSTLEVTGKLVGIGIDPYTLTAWRFVIGGMILLPFALRQVRKDKLQISRSSILHIGSLGILNVCVSMLLLQLSIFYGKASLTAVIVSMNPLFVTGFAMVLIKEKLNRIQLLSLGLGLLGLLLIVFSERDFANSSYLNLPVGVIFAIMASLTFGLWTVLTKSAIVRYGNVFTNALSFLVGGIILMLINLIIGKPAAFSFSMRNLLLVSYLGLFITGVAYLLYFDAMKAISASVASAYFFLKPALATLLAFFILKETLSMGQLVGITLIVVSLVWRPLTNIFSYIRCKNTIVA
ncbi:MAG: DMT family transporter [Candidatus Cloacimonetes bacterium]|nr:DMT family transporter [Candidatus Cloacimonadota bacterium]MDD3235698.1 DMT family transporter [Candidatus Cloacimonadota bacterium]